MSIKIYNTIGLGLLMGKKISQDMEPDKIYLEYPGVLVPNQQTRDGIRNLMVPPIPDFFAGLFELLKKFPLKKSLIIISGTPSPSALELYTNYTKNVRQAITGIVEVGADVMDRLPKNGTGEPIVK